MELYYTHSDNINVKEAVFDSFESHHIIKTMRKREGDTLHFTDGRGKLYSGHIISTKPEVRAQYKLVKDMGWPSASMSTLAVGFIRPSRLDYMIEKTTELGIRKFLLFASQHGNYSTTNISRFEKIIRQAMKQSLRFYLPEIYVFSNFKSLLKEISIIKHKFVADQNAEQHIKDLVRKTDVSDSDDIVFLIGPEGGFSDDEIKSVNANGFNSFSFGNNRLRTETAAISAVLYINLIKN